MPDRTSWPWLTGQWQIARLMATYHREATADPLTRLKKPFEGLNWLEIIDAGLTALKMVGNEIASAKTIEQVESAKLRKHEYEAAFGDAIREMLKIALRQASKGVLVGYGRRSPQEAEKLIPPSFWPFGEFDWESRSLKGDEWVYRDVRFVDPLSAPEDVRAAIEGDLIKARVDPLPVWCQGISGSTEASDGATGPGKFSQVRLESWYKRRVEVCSKNGERPSIDDDVKAAKAELGDGVTRDAVRAVRREHAPNAWKAQGRPKKPAEK